MVTISLTGVDQNAKINRKLEAWEDRYNSKLSYIPAERNLVSAVQNINDTYKAKERDSIFNSYRSGMRQRILMALITS